MGVTAFVTTIASAGCVTVVFTGMAFVAGHDRVQAIQWKSGQAMVEHDFVFPAFGGMAAFTFLAVAAFMFVIDFVAAVTQHAGF